MLIKCEQAWITAIETSTERSSSAVLAPTFLLSYSVCANQCEICLQWEHVVCTCSQGGSFVCLFVFFGMQVIYWLCVWKESDHYAYLESWNNELDGTLFYIKSKKIIDVNLLLPVDFIQIFFLLNSTLSCYLLYLLLTVQPATSQKYWLRHFTALKTPWKLDFRF